MERLFHIVGVKYSVRNRKWWNDGCDVLFSWCSRSERIGEATLAAQKAPNLGHVKLSAAGQSEGVDFYGGVKTARSSNASTPPSAAGESLQLTSLQEVTPSPTLL